MAIEDHIKNPIDAERILRFPKAQRADYRRQMEERDGGCNDAELVAEMRREGTLKSLDPKTYAKPSVRTALKPPEEYSEAFGFKSGETVIVRIFWPWYTEEIITHVISLIDGGMVKTPHGLFPADEVRHAVRDIVNYRWKAPEKEHA